MPGDDCDDAETGGGSDDWRELEVGPSNSGEEDGGKSWTAAVAGVGSSGRIARRR